ncbi:MAG TPA: D-alanyl-D-alanine carboxypeptidase/D-alanyl-D-alanine-endopeptidase [Anaeromyxobacter sp.]|nr:D-alanyl-D-alanine carboxypeptidase/D-alanyl-D-alanine-endopeptidase [Anaeromyxobacter sp.]
MKNPLRAAVVAALLATLSPAVAHAADAAASAKELDAALRAIVAAAPLSGARTGILVADVESGQVLFAKDADVLLNPASNVKLFTTAAALARLGPEYRFSTEFYVDPASRGSSSVRTLHVKGRGDPTLLTERLWAIAGDLAHLGLRRVGEIAVDESFFDAEREGPGFDQESGDRSYLAPAGAASLNWNTVAVHVAPGDRRGARARVELEPASDFLEIDNRATTAAGKGRRRLTVSSVVHGGRQRIVVEGRIPAGSRPQVVWRKIDQPGLYLGHTLARLLALRGVQVGGRVRLAEVPQGARLLHVEQSESLAEIVRRLNKTSNNFVAEQLLKTLGAEAKGAPGTWPKGVAAVEDFLAESGVPRGSFVMKNGSGLNDANRFSARQVVAVLRAMWSRFPVHAEYVASLPVAGRDGTIRYRMEGTEAEGRLRAKTGTLVAGAVTSLSGYVETAGRRALAFAVLVNDYPGRPASVVRSVDAIGAALAASGGAPGAVGAAIAAARGAPPAAGPEASPADLATAIRTYYALGRAADPRNVHLLRSALRAEKEPALRLAIAECVYLSDPDGETSARTFLEAVPADPQVLARLWAASAAEEARPVLPSLGDLAGEGTADAVAKLVEIAPAALADAGIGAALADVLAGVAASAPEELVAALRAAPAVSLDAAVGSLGAGLSQDEERDNPFPAALRALAQKEGEEGAFARALEGRVADAMKASVAARAAPALLPANAALPASATLPAGSTGGR